LEAKPESQQDGIDTTTSTPYKEVIISMKSIEQDKHKLFACNSKCRLFHFEDYQEFLSRPWHEKLASKIREVFI
jgi:hypothetical protein